MHMIFAVRSPPTVEIENATSPSAIIARVCGCRKFSALAVAPTDTPRKIVTMFISSFCAVLERRSVTPQTFKRFPNIKNPISGAASGRIIETTIVTSTGKISFSTCDTGRSAVMTISRSFFEVSKRMNGG